MTTKKPFFFEKTEQWMWRRLQRNIQYSWPSLLAGLLFAVLIICRFILISKNSLSVGFLSDIFGFSYNLLQFNNFWATTVLPCYPRFWYSRDFPPRISIAACTNIHLNLQLLRFNYDNSSHFHFIIFHSRIKDSSTKKFSFE